MIGHLKQRWFQTLLLAIAAVALLVLVVNPELAALSFLFDPIMLDVAIVFFGTQLLLFNGQIRVLLAALSTNILRLFKRPRLKD